MVGPHYPWGIVSRTPESADAQRPFIKCTVQSVLLIQGCGTCGYRGPNLLTLLTLDTLTRKVESEKKKKERKRQEKKNAVSEQQFMHDIICME